MDNFQNPCPKTRILLPSCLLLDITWSLLVKKTYLKHIFIGSLLIPMLHFANEATKIPEEENLREKTHAIVSDRPVEQIEKKEESSAQFFGGSYPSIYYPSGVHYITTIFAFENRVEMEDGAVWTISRYDAPKLMRWLQDHPIIITQNHRWFSKYNYRIVNQVTGESLEANLFQGPFLYGFYTRYIASLDLYSGYAFLNDGTQWRISPYDAFLFDQFRVNDVIIIGHNSGYDSSCQGLLINVNMNESVRAEQF